MKRDVKLIYTAVNAGAARAALDELTEKWGSRYGAVIRLWENAWEQFIPFLDYDLEIRTVICSTNAIESLNARYRRAVKARGHFLSVTWNQGPGSGSLRYGLAGSWKESPCPSSSSRRSGPCWAGTSWRPGGCGSGPIWGGRPGRSTLMPAGWPSTWTSASGRTSTRPRRTGRMSRCSSAS